MKRKLALFLALVMALSLLPMNVFGRTWVAGPIDPAGTLPYWMTVRINLADIASDMRTVGDLYRATLAFELDAVTGNRWDRATMGQAGGVHPSVHPGWATGTFRVGTGTHWTNSRFQISGSSILIPANPPEPAVPSFFMGPAVAVRTDRIPHPDPDIYRVHEALVDLNFNRTEVGNYWGVPVGDPNALAWGMGGHVDVQVNMYANVASNATIRVGVIGAHGETRWITGWMDVFQAEGANPGILFSIAGDATSFESGLVLPRIDMMERRPGDMTFTPTGTPVRTIRMVAPYDYAWSVGIPGHLLGTTSVRLESRNPRYTFVTPTGFPTGYGASADGRFFTVPRTAVRTGFVSNTPLAQFEIAGGIQAGGIDEAIRNRERTAEILRVDRRHYLEIDIPLEAFVTNQAVAAQNLRGVLGLVGIALIPSPHAPMDGNVGIDIAWGPGRPAWGTDVLNTAAALMHLPANRYWRDLWRAVNLNVGIRTDVALEITTTSVPDILSGLMGWPTANMPGPTPRIDNLRNPGFQPRPGNFWDGEGAQHFSGAGTPEAIRSTRVQIRERSAGAFDTGFLNSIVDFHMPEGVQIVHAAWSLHNGGNSPGNWINWTPIVPGYWQGHTGFQPDAWFAGVPYMTENYLRLFVPRNASPTDLRVLEVYFWLSVEAGFEAKFGDEVVISVDGPAVQRLEEDERDVTIAFIVDPVQVELDGPTIQVETGRTHNLLQLTRIGDLVISEETHGRLRTGDEIWIYVVGTNIQRPHTLAFHTATNAVIDSGNLAISPARTLRSTLPGGLEVTGVSFRVERASTSGNASTIRLTDNYLFGEILPGQDYMIVVSGPRLAANEFQVVARGVAGVGGTAHTFRTWVSWPAANWASGAPINLPPGMTVVPGTLVVDNGFMADITITGTGAAGVVTRDTLGVFDSFPYAVPVVEWYGYDPNLIPGPQPGPVRGLGERLVLREGMLPIIANDGSVVYNPFLLHNFGQGYVVSMLNPRVFADFVEGDIEWTEATQTIVFSGYDSNGNNIIVSLQVGSNIANINGQNVDIATFAGNSGPANSIQTIIVADRAFVPLRFLANAFLLPIQWQDGTVILG